MTNAVELTGVTKRFGTQTAVDQVDLRIPQGSIYGFIGPNGSGKTTTIRMILRIFQPDMGTVSVLGRTAGTAADERLGYLPEERGLYKRMKVRDVCAYYAKLKGHYDCQPDIDEWLERLDASDWAEKRVDALSKGMAQKVQFITSVIARPQLLILDEPFSGLDPVNLEVLRDAVLALRERGTTVIFSTHDMDVAEKLCDQIFMIFRGRKVLDGSVDSIRQQYAGHQVGVSLVGDNHLPTLDGVDQVQTVGREHVLHLAESCRPQQILQDLLSHDCEIERFEIQRPSLRDIFVRIAGPEQYADDAGAAA